MCAHNPCRLRTLHTRHGVRACVTRANTRHCPDDATLMRCFVVQDILASYGGVLYADKAVSIEITDCVFSGSAALGGRIYIDSGVRMRACMHAHTHTCVRAHARALRQTDTRTHAHTHTDTHMRAHTHMHACTYCTVQLYRVVA